jgi:predicted  nucleic acid-binding Zn-ribbon protein
MDILDVLDNLRTKIEAAKNQKAQIEGKLQSAYERLQNEFDLQNEEEALKEINALQAEEAQLEEQLTEDYEKLCEEFDLQ